MTNEFVIIEGVVYDPIAKKVIPGKIFLNGEKIERIERDERITGPLILPGFVDSHIHIESSMLTPKKFSEVAVKHGSVAVVADPHEIANVAGVEGINFMINDAKDAKMKFFFGAPSCVPASPFDDCYKVLDSKEIEKLLQRDDIHFLGEFMNFPGVVNKDPDVLKKLEFAKRFNKPIDGHAPALSSNALKAYVDAGITTDHECFTIEEAREKIKLGMKVLIREGSAAKNYNTLHPLISEHFSNVMFCTDDCHPDDLLNGHMNLLVKRSLSFGYNIFDILQIVSVNPVKHYNLNVGLLQVGDPADFIIIDNLEKLTVLSTYINGTNVLKEDNKVIEEINNQTIQYKFISGYKKELIKLNAKTPKAKIINVIDGELVTEQSIRNIKIEKSEVLSDTENDVLKIVVVNRYKYDEVSVGLIKGFGISRGAIAESIAHDSHHIIAVGADDDSIIKCLDFVINNKGGICYFNGQIIEGLSLPVYGLMSFNSAEKVANVYSQINSSVINDGCKLKSPFMTLSFMALTVIPKLKIAPRGLFDVEKFEFVDLFS